MASSTGGALAGAKLLFQQRDVFDYPMIERRTVNLDAALFHHFFFELSIARWIGHLPADAPEDHATFKMTALATRLSRCSAGPVLSDHTPAQPGKFATEPD